MPSSAGGTGLPFWMFWLFLVVLGTVFRRNILIFSIFTTGELLLHYLKQGKNQ